MVAAVVLGAHFGGLLRPLDDGLADLRFRLLERPVSGTLATVEIDSASLQAAGRWPWDRERYAVAIEKLQKAGAKVVAFDVDFSAPSDPQSDRRLQAAVEAHPGAVILPVFVQRSARGPDGVVVENAPLPALAAQSVLASVNVPVDPDGRVRRYPFALETRGGPRPSIGALLAEAPPGRAGTFLLDYGIRVEDVPHLSFEAVYQGRFDPAAVRGRSVLIGATALELGDEFATPRVGTMPGVDVHALAYESVLAGRTLTRLNPYATLLIAGLVVVLLRPRRRPMSLKALLARHVAVGTGALVLPLWLQGLAPVTLDVGPILLAQALVLVWSVRRELDRRAEAIVREREAGLLHLAMHEPETGLPNRRALSAEIDGRLAEQEDALAVVAVGIDRYPVMRGAVGYHMATLVVRALAERLAEASGQAQVAHLSTSVLGLALSAPSRAELMEQVQRLERLSPAFQIGEHAVDAFVRLGVAYRGPHGETAEQLLENASLALDRARRIDRRTVAYDAAAFVDPRTNLALMSDMRKGLKAGEISLCYQPKVCPTTGRVAGVEALVRWEHPTRGPIAPGVFIGAAEETGAIRGLTEWALERVLADRAKLREAGRTVSLALNVSPRLLTDGGFLERALKSVRKDAREITFEITETAVVRSPEAAMAAIAAYRAAGVKIAIDDYGAGLSSLAYLKMIHAHELKLDRSLVSGAAASERERLILKSTIDLAHGLGMQVVAEGVESEAVREALAELGCDAIQGYLIARAMPLDELIDFLAAEPARATAA
ncbi:putative bifunctional diguanylate cyclase/phosphodiesterase [Phenylobacterium sp.]|uniref:putative bifunctional diguanylate cyclase/phosphodiesterase n=1 Tax=Phenylobacterium sp. TaxID=1871053 RepID=UPI002FE064F9